MKKLISLLLVCAMVLQVTPVMADTVLTDSNQASIAATRNSVGKDGQNKTVYGILVNQGVNNMRQVPSAPLTAAMAEIVATAYKNQKTPCRTSKSSARCFLV